MGTEGFSFLPMTPDYLARETRTWLEFGIQLCQELGFF